jgi:hypothetical protein
VGQREQIDATCEMPFLATTATVSAGLKGSQSGRFEGGPGAPSSSPEAHCGADCVSQRTAVTVPSLFPATQSAISRVILLRRPLMPELRKSRLCLVSLLTDSMTRYSLSAPVDLARHAVVFAWGDDVGSG